jgi:DDE superfamily endonuclease
MGRWLWNRFTVHYTPTHGSWLNQAEIEISLFGRQCLGRRRIGDIGQLRRQAKAWNRRTNRDRITIKWKFTRKQARRKLNYSITRSSELAEPCIGSFNDPAAFISPQLPAVVISPFVVVPVESNQFDAALFPSPLRGSES